MPKTRKKLVFYVDTECSFSNREKCSYYSSEKIQKQARNSAKEMWGDKCCPIVYLKTGRKFIAFCPTKGGPFGEQLPTTVTTPGPSALRVLVHPQEEESWAQIVERAAKTACETKCE